MTPVHQRRIRPTTIVTLWPDFRKVMGKEVKIFRDDTGYHIVFGDWCKRV